MTRKTLMTFYVVLLSISTVFSGETEEKAKFEKYKDEMKKDSSLIRFYTFEEGYGDEAANHVVLDSSRISMSGGPLGSLSIQRHPRGTHADRYDPKLIPPAWTQGRWSWKAALSNGIDTSNLPWEVTKFFRSGITGVEFAKGGTISGWFRIHESKTKSEGCCLFRLGDGWGSGFTLDFNKVKWCKDGQLEFRLGASKKNVKRVALQTQPCLPGVWHYFAVTFDDKMVKLYLDGELKNEKPSTGPVVPTSYKDYPLVGPFFENNTPTRFGSFFMVAHNPAGTNRKTARFDLGELAIYNRALSADEIKSQELAGRPDMSKEAQLADFRLLRDFQKEFDRIRMDIPMNTGGYFRIDKPVVATVEIPADSKLKGNLKVVFDLETLNGKPVKKLDRVIKIGQTLTESFKLNECGVYYLDMILLDATGKVIKRIPEKICFAIIPPAPKELTEHNPMAYWGVNRALFHYDAPIRRMGYYSKNDFIKRYENYIKIVPNLRTYAFVKNRISDKPEDQDFNRKQFTEAAEVMKDKRIFGLEVTSEPHTNDYKGYVSMLSILSDIFRKEMPGIVIAPPGAAPPSIPMIAGILKEGGGDYIDGVSYHPYTANPIHSFLWNNLTDRLKKVLAEYPDKRFIMWQTEGGVACLPRMKGRPMTRKDAQDANFSVAQAGNHTFFTYFVSMRPEAESAAMQCHDILLSLVQGYKFYTNCNMPDIDGLPSLRAVAMTALAGQILNKQKEISRLPLAVVENMCVLIDNVDGTRTATVFSMDPATMNLQVESGGTYKTMDMLGNYSSITANSDGLLTIKSVKAPLYIFDVPKSMKEVVPLRISTPSVLPENRLLKGEVVVCNPFTSPLVGTLAVKEIRGASIKLDKTNIDLAPGKSETVGIKLMAEFLKRRKYLLSIELKDPKGNLVAGAQTLFLSQGVLQMLPEVKTPFKLDGDEAKWKNIPEVICDNADSVVKGNPNYAEVWVPQWINKEDLSLRLRTAWCKDDGLYFFLKVSDDKLIPAPEDQQHIFKYDCIELFVDTREYAKLGAVITPGADQIMIVPNVTDKIERCVLKYARSDKNHVNVECVGRKTKDGYLIEGKIIPNEKSDFRVRAGSQFMMDFLVDDTDSLDPKWMRKSAMAVHGKFDNCNNSNIWGHYELSLMP